MADEITIAGGAQLDAFLQTLATKVQRNIMRAALRAGAIEFRTAARDNVPVDLGELKKSLRVTTSAKGSVVTAKVIAGSQKAFYWRFVEFGTAPHRIGPNKFSALNINGRIVEYVNHPGARPHPFMRPAFDAKGEDAVAAVANKIRDRLTLAGIDVPAPVDP